MSAEAVNALWNPKTFAEVSGIVANARKEKRGSLMNAIIGLVNAVIAWIGGMSKRAVLFCHFPGDYSE